MKSSDRLYLLQLMLAADWIPLKETRPALSAKQRVSLVSDRLIEQERRGRSTFVRLSDRGWLWCAEHLHDPLGIPRNASATLLEQLLRVISKWLTSEGRSLAQFISTNNGVCVGTVDENSESQLVNDSEVERQIEMSSLQIAGGKGKVRVRLASLRDALPSVPREELDQTLLRMSLAGRLQLMSLDNPHEINEGDRQAALYTPSGEVRHILYWVA